MKIYAITPKGNESAWLRYQLDLAGISLSEVAKGIGVTHSAVSFVISGSAHSARIEKEIARIIGYPSWNEMLLELRSKAV